MKAFLSTIEVLRRPQGSDRVAGLHDPDLSGGVFNINNQAPPAQMLCGHWDHTVGLFYDTFDTNISSLTPYGYEAAAFGSPAGQPVLGPPNEQFLQNISIGLSNVCRNSDEDKNDSSK